MLTKKQLASKPVNLTVLNNTAYSSYLINKELTLFPKKSSILINDFFKISPENKSKSIIYKALKVFLRNSYYNKDNAENILSEAFCLFQEASIKFFEKKREFNFEQFAIVHIRGGIKSFLNKINKLNSSDQNELIHTAIKIIKKNSNKTYLSFDEVKYLVDHFNLCSKKGPKKIWRLEALHHDDIPLWKEIENSEGSVEEVCVVKNEKINLYDNNSQNDFDDPSLEIEKKEENKDYEIKKNILNNFKTQLKKKNEKIIFEKRIFNNSENFLKLKELSIILNISIQRISIIEKNIKLRLKEFYIIEKNKNTDIK